jgi:Zn-finger nucleic acid-binding protein
MSEENPICPDCQTKLRRKYNISGVLYECPKCGKEWVWSSTLRKLLTRKEFYQRAMDEK